MKTTRDGNLWEYAANSAWSLPLRKIYADGSAISYEYAPDGKPLRTVRASGRWTENHYDSQNRLTAIESGTTNGVSDAASFFAYGALSRLASASNEVASYTYTHSTLGVVTSETVNIGAFTASLERGIDDRSRVTSLNIAPNATFYAYNSENHLSAISNAVFSLTYLYERDLVSGYDIEIAGASPSNSVLTRRLSRRRAYPEKISEINHAFNGTPISRRINNYDLILRKTEERLIGTGAYTNTYGYNKRSEISKTTYESSSNLTGNFDYDDIGNLTSATGRRSSGHISNELNQYVRIADWAMSAYTLAYDIDGNLISDRNFNYTWDSAGRLSAVYSNSTCIVSNAYDHLSRRVLKTTPAATHTFVYDGWNPILEVIAHTSGTTTTNQYFWGLDLSGSTQGAGGVGGLVTVSLDGALYFPLSDSNGNITEYVDSTGAVVAQYRYDAFGDMLNESGAMSGVFAFRFSTKYIDPETELYYYGYRFYSPVLRRWINRDPIEEKGGLNLYGFCVNDGVNWFDALGTHRMLTGALIFKRGVNLDLEGYAYARKIIRYLDNLNQKKDSNGRKYFKTQIKDLVTTPIADVKSDVEKSPDDVYLIAHGGLLVNGSAWKARTYLWNNKDTVIEGLDINHNGKITPLSEFGPKLNSQNIFGCYISPRVRRVKTSRIFSQHESSLDTFNAMFSALFARLKRYDKMTDGPCGKEIIIYEGERTSNGISTEEALRRFPIKPEFEYTGNQYDWMDDE